MRTLGRVKLEFQTIQLLQEQNRTLTGMIAWCDSIREINNEINYQKDIIIIQKNIQLEDQRMIINLQNTKFDLASVQIRKERKGKFLFMGATATVIAVAIVVIVKNSIQTK